MKTLMVMIGLAVSCSSLSQQRMITFDTSGDSIVETSDVNLSNVLSMTAEYNAVTTEIILVSNYVDGKVTNDKFLVKGITTMETFKIYELRRENVTFEVVIGETYFILQYEDYYDVFPQINSQQ